MSERTREPLLVGAALAQRPGVGGHAWFVLQWLLGLRRLGFDPVLVDRAVGSDHGVEQQVDWVRAVLGPFGFDRRWSVDVGGGEVAGLPHRELVALAAGSPFLLNVMGFVDDEEVLAAAPVRVFLDIDPGFSQLWCDLGLADLFTGHDRFVTVGTAVNDPTSKVPTCGREWLPILPPVVLEHCPILPLPTDRRYTTVASWRGPFGPVEHGGRTYGLRVHEFRRFLALPALVSEGRHRPPAFEVALDIDRTETADRDRLGEHGWKLIDPGEAAGSIDRYLAFISASSAEIQIAKNLYVATSGGWFSDRSATYLAMGRPVIAQETGFSSHLPTGRGLLPFTTLEEAGAAATQVLDDLDSHSAAARDLAEQHLDSDLVIQRLLAEIAL